MPQIPSFLDVIHANAPAAKAQVHVIPAPMETTVCYGGGTARAPRAILEASRQLDDFDGRRWHEPQEPELPHPLHGDSARMPA